MKAKHAATNITGTVAKPSNPSVRFTAFEDRTITNKENGTKNKIYQIGKELINL